MRDFSLSAKEHERVIGNLDDVLNAHISLLQAVEAQIESVFSCFFDGFNFGGKVLSFFISGKFNLKLIMIKKEGVSRVPHAQIFKHAEVYPKRNMDRNRKYANTHAAKSENWYFR